MHRASPLTNTRFFFCFTSPNGKNDTHVFKDDYSLKQAVQCTLRMPIVISQPHRGPPWVWLTAGPLNLMWCALQLRRTGQSRLCGCGSGCLPKCLKDPSLSSLVQSHTAWLTHPTQIRRLEFRNTHCLQPISVESSLMCAKKCVTYCKINIWTYIAFFPLFTIVIRLEMVMFMSSVKKISIYFTSVRGGER